MLICSVQLISCLDSQSKFEMFTVFSGCRAGDRRRKTPRGGGGFSQKNWVGVCGPFPKTPTIFMTKISDIPYPIYDLTKNSKPYL